jgi:hypothetical protein
MSSYFKYEIDTKQEESKYEPGRQAVSHSLESNSIRNERNNRFFRRPRIKITGLESNLIKIHSRGINGSEFLPEELFDACVWKIGIKNDSKLDIITENSAVSLYLRNINHWLKLNWVSRLGFTTSCNIIGAVEEDASGSYREDYLKRLGLSYVMDLMSESSDNQQIAKGKSAELLFLVAISESRFAYIITPDGTIGWYDNDNMARLIDDAFLILGIPSVHEIYLKFKNTGKTYKFKLELNSYNDIRLTKA